VDLLCFEKTMQLHSFTPVSVQYAVLVSGSLVNAVFQKCPLTHPPAHPHCPPLAQKKKIREKLAKKRKFLL